MKQNGLLNLVKQVQAWPIQPCNDCRFISEEFVIVRSVVGMRDLKQFSDRFRTTLSIDGRAYRASAFRVCSDSGQFARSDHKGSSNGGGVSGTVAEFVEMSPDCGVDGGNCQ
ncbi:MAG: hypothetical protein ACLU4N_19640 [Butyricimonas faecihominis]